MNLNELGKRSYISALKRGKIHENFPTYMMHNETVHGLREEVQEVDDASEVNPSEHLSEYSEVVEELIDVALVAFTELYRRGINIEEALHRKMKYNEHRR